ncbi:MAG: hypothetical protein ACP5E2_02770 [Terracidiphilus sp.]
MKKAAKKAKRELTVRPAAKPAIRSILDVDVRITIGMFFTLTGTILSAFGYSTRDRADLYVKSLGIDANLWCGLVMLVFGIVMLAFGRRAQMKLERAGNSESL